MVDFTQKLKNILNVQEEQGTVDATLESARYSGMVLFSALTANQAPPAVKNLLDSAITRDFGVNMDMGSVRGIAPMRTREMELA